MGSLVEPETNDKVLEGAIGLRKGHCVDRLDGVKYEGFVIGQDLLRDYSLDVFIRECFQATRCLSEEVDPRIVE